DYYCQSADGNFNPVF
nr:immunoglobulin light chain junction region [Macaca mulatta]MOW31747.1 immunoglobulin light chain junction region [Macaca mulatta]MOW31952.1 immunoglobulin light chain junction region [Macaca mulatta]